MFSIVKYSGIGLFFALITITSPFILESSAQKGHRVGAGQPYQATIRRPRTRRVRRQAACPVAQQNSNQSVQSVNVQNNNTNGNANIAGAVNKNSSTNIADTDNRNANINANVTSPSPIAPSTPQSLKISTNGIELSGFPTWINITILVIGGLVLLSSLWVVPKIVEEKSKIGAGMLLLVCIILFFFIGRIWDRWGASSEIQEKVDIAKKESRNETLPSPPAAPNGLTALPVSSSQVNLSWGDNSFNEEWFKLERKISSGSTFIQVAILGPNATSYADTGLAPDTSASYRVRAYNTYGDSTYSNEATTTTLPPHSDRDFKEYFYLMLLALGFSMGLGFLLILNKYLSARLRELRINLREK